MINQEKIMHLFRSGTLECIADCSENAHKEVYGCGDYVLYVIEDYYTEESMVSSKNATIKWLQVIIDNFHLDGIMWQEDSTTYAIVEKLYVFNESILDLPLKNKNSFIREFPSSTLGKLLKIYREIVDIEEWRRTLFDINQDNIGFRKTGEVVFFDVIA